MPNQDPLSWTTKEMFDAVEQFVKWRNDLPQNKTYSPWITWTIDRFTPSMLSDMMTNFSMSNPYANPTLSMQRVVQLGILLGTFIAENHYQLLIDDTQSTQIPDVFKDIFNEKYSLESDSDKDTDEDNNQDKD